MYNLYNDTVIDTYDITLIDTDDTIIKFRN